jgi:hypothetical protein
MLTSLKLWCPKKTFISLGRMVRDKGVNPYPPWSGKMTLVTYPVWWVRTAFTAPTHGCGRLSCTGSRAYEALVELRYYPAIT